MLERQREIVKLARDAGRGIVAAVAFSAIDTLSGDESAREQLALVQLVVEKIRKLLDRPVPAVDRGRVVHSSTIPAEAP